MPDHTERRKSDAFIQERIDSLATRMDAVEQWAESFELKMSDVGNEVKANTALTEEIHGKTDDIFQIVTAARGAFKVLDAAGKLAKPLIYVGGFAAAVWALLSTGHWPK
jgi:hypothetical protein